MWGNHTSYSENIQKTTIITEENRKDFLPLFKQVFRTAVLNRLEGKEEGISRGELRPCTEPQNTDNYFYILSKL